MALELYNYSNPSGNNTQPSAGTDFPAPNSAPAPAPTPAPAPANTGGLKLFNYDDPSKNTVAPAPVAPTTPNVNTETFGQNYQDIMSNIGSKLGLSQNDTTTPLKTATSNVASNIVGGTASFGGGVVTGLGSLVDFVGGNIARALNKVMPIVPDNRPTPAQQVVLKQQMNDAFENNDFNKMDAIKAELDTPAPFSEVKNATQSYEDLINKDVGEDTTTNKDVQSFSQGTGEFVGKQLPLITTGTELAEATGVPKLLGGMLRDVPIVGQYLDPIVANTIKNLAGFSLADQPDAEKNAQTKADVSKAPVSQNPHWDQFVSDLGNSALFGTIGTIPKALYSVPAIGIAAYGSAKLGGASDPQALASAVLVASMHGAGYVGDQKIETPEQALQRVKSQSIDTINKYATDKIDENSTPQQIDKAFRQASLVTHPDVGGDDKTFAGVSAARDFLKAQNTVPEIIPQKEPTNNTNIAQIETPAQQEYKSAKGTLMESKPSEIRDNLNTLNEKLETIRENGVNPKEEATLIGKINATRDTFNAYTSAHKQVTYSIPSSAGSPTLDISVVPFDDGKYAVSTNAKLGNSGMGSPFGSDDTYPTREQAINAGKTQVQNWLDGEKKGATPAVLSQIKTIEKTLGSSTSETPEKPKNITLHRGTHSGSRVGANKENLKENMYLTPDKDTAQYYAKLSADRFGTKPVVHSYDFAPSEVEEIGKTNEFRVLGKNEKPNKSVLPSKKLKGALTEYDTPKVIKARELAKSQTRTSEIKTPEREALRAKVTDKVYGKGAPVKGKRLDIVTGGAGTRKSSMLAEPLAKEHGSMIVDSDRVKPHLPEFGKNGEGANAVHQESAVINKDVLMRALDNGDNVVFPTIGRGQGALDKVIDIAHSKGYEIHLHHAELSPDIAIPSTIKRFEAGEQGFVDPANSIPESLQSNELHDIIKSNEKLTSQTKYSTDVKKGENPTVLESSTRGERPAGKSGSVDEGRSKQVSNSTGRKDNGMGNNTENGTGKKEIVPRFAKPKITIEKQPEIKTRAGGNTQGGFVAPAKAIADIKAVAGKLQTHFEETNKAVKFAKNLDDTLFKTQKNAQADTIEKIHLIKEVKNLLTPAEWENVYHYREALAAGVKLPTLTEKEKTANDEIITPINKQNAHMASLLKDNGIPLSEDSLNPRQVKGKGSMLDRAISQKDRLFKNGGGGGKNVLKQSAPELKKRTMRALTDENGNRTVVAIKGGRVTAFNKGNPTDLGAIKANVAPKVKEFYDPEVRTKLEKLAKDLGIRHEVHATGRTSGLGGGRAGVSFTGENLIKTRLTPDSVLAHEIGHQIDDKYGMQDFMNEERYDAERKGQVRDEMRALADKRFEGKDVSDNFKKYVRKGSEKMAVMFEAYVSNKEMFKSVAPHLYSDFSDFLYSHPLLKQFADIEGSVKLQSQMHGGNLKSGKKGDTFIDKNGKSYTIGEATTKEIEGNTKLTYYKNPFVNAMIANNDLTQAYRATQTLEALKKSPEFNDNFIKVDEGVPPEGWKPIKLDQLRGYYAEPHIADTLNAFAKDLDSSDPLAALSAINNFVTSSVFLTPVGHFINVGASSVINRGLSGLLNPMRYPRLIRTTIRAVRDVATQNEEYINILRAGAPFMSNSGDAKEFKENLLDIMGEKPDAQKQMFNKAKKALGVINPIVWTHKLTWPANDMLLLQQVLETQEMKGISTEDAIKDVTKVLPDYRLPVKVRLAGKPITRNLTAFLTYRLNTINSFLEVAKSLATGNGGEKSMQINPVTGKRTYGEYTNKESFKARAEALNKIGMALALGLIVIPIINKKLQEMSGNPYTHLHEPAQLAVVDNVNKLINGDLDFGAWAQTIISPAIATSEILQQFLNLDTFTGNPIRIAGTSASDQLKASLQHAETAVTPLNDVNRVQAGKTTRGELLASLAGIDNPHTGSGTVKSNSLIYDLKPNIETQMKADIVAGNRAGAIDLMNKFNANLKKAYVQTYKEQGKTPSIFKMNDDMRTNGIKMPSGTSMTNYRKKIATAGKS